MNKITFFLLLIAPNLWAQKVFVVDTFLNPDPRSLGVGKGYAICLIPRILFRNDSITRYDYSHEKRRFFRMTIMPPQYDSTRVELLPEYSYWVLRKDARNMVNNKYIVSIEPPKYAVSNLRQKVGEDLAIVKEGTKSKEALSVNPDDCHVVYLVEVPLEYKPVQRHTLQDSAKIVYRREWKQWSKVLDSTSPLLVKVTVPPQYAYAKTHDYRKQRIIFESDVEISDLLSDWREYIYCGRMSNTVTVVDIQNALVARGYLRKVNEKLEHFNNKTKRALVRFQRDKGLPVGNVNIETLRSLGLGN